MTICVPKKANIIKSDWVVLKQTSFWIVIYNEFAASSKRYLSLPRKSSRKKEKKIQKPKKLCYNGNV